MLVPYPLATCRSLCDNCSYTGLKFAIYGKMKDLLADVYGVADPEQLPGWMRVYSGATASNLVASHRFASCNVYDVGLSVACVTLMVLGFRWGIWRSVDGAWFTVHGLA
jgi:hypothetical protein